MMNSPAGGNGEYRPDRMHRLKEDYAPARRNATAAAT
jgi:hypothetical protein